MSWRATAGVPRRTPPAYLLEHLRPTDHVLDVGCGPGTITQGLAARVPQGRVVGVDAAEAVIAAASADAV